MERVPGTVGRLTLRQAAELYHVHGLKCEEVGERAGVHKNTVTKAFRKHGIPMRRRKILRQDFEMAKSRGWSKARLARHLGVSRYNLYKAQAREGFSWPERDWNRDYC